MAVSDVYLVQRRPDGSFSVYEPRVGASPIELHGDEKDIWVADMEQRIAQARSHT